MLKHLVESRKGNTFDWVVGEFLSGSDPLYTRNSFTNAFQQVTRETVFANHQSIDDFFDSWTFQYGYPIVEVHRRGHVLYFTQSVCPVSKNVDRDQSFVIPISIIAEPNAEIDINKTHPDIWLTKITEEIAVDIRGLSKWFLINNQRTGYYRVLYEDWNYKLLRFELLRGDLTKISPVSRGQLVDDVLFMAKIGNVRYDRALEMVEYLKLETEETPWEMASFELHELNYYLRYTPAYAMFKHFMKVISRRFYKVRVEDSLEWSVLAMQWACFGQLQRCREFTYTTFLGIIKNRESYDHLYEIICNGVKSSDYQTFIYIKLSLLNRLQSLDQELYLHALSCFENRGQLKESLNLIFRGTSLIAASLTPAGKFRVVSGMCARTEEGAQAVLDFSFQHPSLVLRGLGHQFFHDMLLHLSKSIYKRRHQRQLRAILAHLGITNTEDIFTHMQWKRKWIELHLTYVTKLLADYSDVEVLEDYEET